MYKVIAGFLLGIACMFLVARACEGPIPEPLKYTEFVVDTIVSEPDTVVQFVEPSIQQRIVVLGPVGRFEFELRIGRLAFQVGHGRHVRHFVVRVRRQVEADILPGKP